MNYTWKLKSLRRKDTQNLQNIIVQTYWEKIGTDENGNSGTFPGATPFELNTVDPENFVSYEDLTEEIILSWIQGVVVGGYEEHVNQQIANQISDKVSPVTEVTSGFPWESPVVKETPTSTRTRKSTKSTKSTTTPTVEEETPVVETET